MAELTTIARPYAEAIFSLAMEESSLDKWSDALANLAIIVKNPDMAMLIADPEQDEVNISTLFFDILAEQSNEALKNLFALLQDNNRLMLLPEILAQYESLKAEAESVIDAVAQSAFPISDIQHQELTTLLSSKYGKTVRLSVRETPELIGGVRVLIGDDVIDASVRGKLQAMAASLKN